MMHAKTDSDDTSFGLSSSSQGSPKRPVYYVNSPSGDSHNASNTPMDSYGTTTTSTTAHHSRASSTSTRISRSYNPTFGDSANRKLVEKGFSDGKVTDEEEDGYDDEFYYGRNEFSRKTQILIAIIGFALIFCFFIFIFWTASLHYKPQLSIKSLTVHNLYFGVGSDRTGVPTKMLTVNCSMQMTVHNPATYFDIYVGSNSVNLMYSELTVAIGELKKYHQRRKSLQVLTVNLQGRMVPLYGAGATLSTNMVENERIPMRLVSEVKSRGYVIGALVRTKHTQHVSCSVAVDSHNNKAIKLEENACSYKVLV